MTDMKDQAVIDAMDEEIETITLEFDDGETVECLIEGVFDADGKEYIALVSCGDNPETYIYGFKEVGDDQFELMDITDEEFDVAAAAYDEIVNAAE